MLYGSQIAGRFRCPRCVGMRLFAVVPGEEQSTSPPLECGECGYVLGPVRVERPDGGVEYRDPLTPEARSRALAEYVAEWRERQIANGYRLENFTHGRRTS